LAPPRTSLTLAEQHCAFDQMTPRQIRRPGPAPAGTDAGRVVAPMSIGGAGGSPARRTWAGSDSVWRQDGDLVGAPGISPTGASPFVGALSVLVDGEGRARAIVETTRVGVVPFGEIGEDFASTYGECASTLAWFRGVIGAFLSRRLVRRLALTPCPPDASRFWC
jgi:hypothetical protein